MICCDRSTKSLKMYKLLVENYAKAIKKMSSRIKN